MIRSHCQWPFDLHCPGCRTCWPDHTCSPDCDATDAEMDAVLAAADEWDEICAEA